MSKGFVYYHVLTQHWPKPNLRFYQTENSSFRLELEARVSQILKAVANKDRRFLLVKSLTLDPDDTGLHFVHHDDDNDDDEIRGFTWVLFHLSPKSSFWSHTSLSMLAPFAKRGRAIDDSDLIGTLPCLEKFGCKTSSE